MQNYPPTCPDKCRKTTISGNWRKLKKKFHFLCTFFRAQFVSRSTFSPFTSFWATEQKKLFRTESLDEFLFGTTICNMPIDFLKASFKNRSENVVGFLKIHFFECAVHFFECAVHCFECVVHCFEFAVHFFEYKFCANLWPEFCPESRNFCQH